MRRPFPFIVGLSRFGGAAVVVVPNIPGLEFTVQDLQADYTLDASLLHETLVTNRLHVEMDGRVHSTMPVNRLHFTLDDEDAV